MSALAVAHKEFEERPIDSQVGIIRQRDKLLAAMRIIEAGELPDGDGVNIPTQLFAEEILKEIESSGHDKPDNQGAQHGQIK